ncbi:ubinuclein-1-like isoform X2 [Salvia miltiorrhiza]|uniref:ubinuclein-1-like isoform X2 n=1 Tax=Salvia miltiorrhiza TaxID=226208 RepID=UPI0025AD8D7E|nr:ubinuclein-1-like isoform X2 [Salvia miltiorrhiza]
MVEGAESGGPENGPGSKPAPSVEVGGGRVRFRVDLKPGETTIVSWKKLLKEANLSETARPGPSGSGPSLEAHGGVVSEPLPPPPPAAASHTKETAENEPKESQANRLSNVIERIERMYAGSSDEEDLVLDNMPDDDEYDTDDSFIDDTELDDYFQVDKSAIKHDGFFVNRGKLERIEPSISMDQQPKKRRRKDLAQGGGSGDGHSLHKIMKMENKGKKAASSIPRSSTNQVYKEAISNVQKLGLDSPANPTEVSIKKTAIIQVAADSSGLQNGDAISQDMYKDRQKPGVNPSEKHLSKSKESELSNTSTQRSNDKISHVRKSHSGKQLDNVNGLDMLIQQKDKGAIVEKLDLNVAACRASLPAAEESLVQRKEGSSVRPKNTNLEKAFRELEKIVEQFRPPSTDAQDPVNQSQSGKKRLPPEIKLKLAKVARIAGSCYGRIPKDVINRLMSILGHLMQITTLKRNLRAMANSGLSAKQEKDDQIQKMKQEVSEMVKSRTARMKSKEACPEEREALKRKYNLDDVLENKICDLYDLYVERLEEDSGPPVRKLYEELALLWPSGFMNTDGIKRAIYRAKDRKGLCSFRKDREKIKKKKVLASKAQDASNDIRAMNSHEKLLSRDRGSNLASNPVPGAARAPVVASANGPNPKQEKTKNGPNPGSLKQEKTKKLISSSAPDHTDPKLSSLLPKKKVKRKPDAKVVEATLHLEKLVVSQGGETA